MKPESHVPVIEYAREHPVLALPGETRMLDHLPQLDGVRAIAVGLVLWSHFLPDEYKFLRYPPYGAIGVGLFFVLSGFLITRILVNCNLKVTAARDVERPWTAIAWATAALVFVYNNPPTIERLGLQRALPAIDIAWKALALALLCRVLYAIVLNLWSHGRQYWQLFKQFYVRRFLRIFPLYYGVLAIIYAFNVTDFRKRASYSFLYFTNYRFSYGEMQYSERWIRRTFLGWKQAQLNAAHWRPGQAIERHLWSLSVEEQFYIVWPLLMLLCPRRLLLPVIIGTIALGPWWRTLNYTPGLLKHEWMMPGCLDLLAAGALLALLCIPKIGLTRVRDGFVQLCGVVGVPMMIAFVAQRWYPTAIGKNHKPYADGYDWLDYGGAIYPVTAAVGIWVIGTAARGFRGPIGWFLTCPPVVYLGRISYGVYVLHLMIPALLAWLFPHVFGGQDAAGNRLPRYWWHLWTYTAISIGLASLSWHLYEAPINRLKRYFEYDKRDAAKASTPAVSA